ncbi:hypothetical protein CARUB_v10010615mg [Capsella rubella]|uniref:Uncharacterized protein n=1 Tax=Capsella rubella TaxID=81985 RepID=R0GK53_9BRAS|nr:hypothetical protein CARUB_v10010615mg [Capsella rubella]
MASSTFSSMLFLLLLVFSLHLDEALGSQTEIRKLKETIKMRRNLEGDDHRSSKMSTEHSQTRHCKGRRTSLENMATTYRPDQVQFGPLPSPCASCRSPSANCYRCVTTRRCEGFKGSPLTCTTSEKCTRISGP